MASGRPAAPSGPEEQCEAGDLTSPGTVTQSEVHTTGSHTPTRALWDCDNPCEELLFLEFSGSTIVLPPSCLCV